MTWSKGRCVHSGCFIYVRLVHYQKLHIQPVHVVCMHAVVSASGSWLYSDVIWAAGWGVMGFEFGAGPASSHP